mgnify:FL=1
MPINFPSNLKATNGEFALIRAEDTAIQGWTHVSTTAERNALQEETMRCPGAVVVVGTIPYVYTSAVVTDGPWGNVDNWVRLDESGGPETIEGLTDVDVNSPQPDQVLLWDNSGQKWVNETLAYSDVAGTPVLATVAQTGLYSDLEARPIFATVAETGLYSDLEGRPVLGTTATTNLYGDLSELPSFVGGTGITITEGVNGAGGVSYTFTGGTSGSTTLDALTDTDITTPLNGQVLMYEINDGTWDNVSRSFANDITVQALPAAGGGQLSYDGISVLRFSPADLSPYLTSVGINDLTGVDTGGAVSGSILEYDGSDWVVGSIPSAPVASVNGETGVVIITLDDVEGVVVPSPGTGDVLTFNGVSWVNQALPGGGDALVANGIDQFVDVAYNGGTPTSGQMLEWVGATWRNVASSKLDTLTVATSAASGGGSLSFDGADELTYTPPDLSAFLTSVSLNSLTDVSTAGATPGEVLKYNGSSWAPAADDAGGGGATELGGNNTYRSKLFSTGGSPLSGDSIIYNSGDDEWQAAKVKYGDLDLTGADLVDNPGFTNAIYPLATTNGILGHLGGGQYGVAKAAEEHETITMISNPPDGEYYMAVAIPAGGTVSKVTATVVGSGATFQYRVWTGTLGGTTTAITALTTCTTKGDATLQSSSLTENQELWVEIASAADVEQLSITVKHSNNLKFVG